MGERLRRSGAFHLRRDVGEKLCETILPDNKGGQEIRKLFTFHFYESGKCGQQFFVRKAEINVVTTVVVAPPPQHHEIMRRTQTLLQNAKSARQRVTDQAIKAPSGEDGHADRPPSPRQVQTGCSSIYEAATSGEPAD
jgi:hypothetical protein